MASNEPKVTAKNKIFIVDPNPPGMGMHPPEDMFLYVKFSAMNRNRNTYLGDNEEDRGKDVVVDLESPLSNVIDDCISSVGKNCLNSSTNSPKYS